MFSLFPYDCDGLDFTFLKDEVNRSWVFFHPMGDLKWQNFLYNGVFLKWTSINYYEHVYLADEGPIKVNSSLLYLKQALALKKTEEISGLKPSRNEKWKEGVDYLLEGGHLSIYTYGGKHL
ncbi:unnamed protein product [Cochlearia groenlandica]